MNCIGKLGILIALAWLCLAPPLARCQDYTIETDGYLYDDSKLIGFPMPKAWKFTDKRSKPVPKRHGESVIAFGFHGDTENFGDILVHIWMINGSAPTNRLQTMFERDGANGKLARGDAHEDKYFVELKPVVHAYYHQAVKPSLTHLLAYRRANGRAMCVAYTIPNEHFAQARLPLLELATRVKCNLPLWPERAKGYEYVTESGIELAFLPDVAAKHRKVMRKLVKTAVRDFTKLHGKPFLTKDEPLVIYVERNDAVKTELLHAKEPSPAYWLSRGIRRMVVPVIANPKSAEARWLVGNVTDYLLFTVYPESVNWLFMGEEGLARMKVKCGKALPYVPLSWKTDMRAVPHRLEIATDPKTRLSFADAAAIVSFFRIGPPQARKAYSQLLAELRTGTEPQAAVDNLVKQFGGKEGQNLIRSVIGKKAKVVKDT